jgi:hypothetical protein
MFDEGIEDMSIFGENNHSFNFRVSRRKKWKQQKRQKKQSQSPEWSYDEAPPM